MKYEAKVTSVTDLMDAGITPAQAAAIHVVAKLALAALADGCNHLASLGASPDEIDAYRQKAGEDVAEWVLRHQAPVAAGIQHMLDERLAVRNDVVDMIG